MPSDTDVRAALEAVQALVEHRRNPPANLRRVGGDEDEHSTITVGLFDLETLVAALQPSTAIREAREETPLSEVYRRALNGTFYADYDWASGPALRALRQAASLRPEVWAFARLMEERLRANDHKSGWKYDSPANLARRVNQEAEELFDVAHDMDNGRAQAGDPPLDSDRWAELSAEAGREAADVANMAMMVADVCGALAFARETTP